MILLALALLQSVIIYDDPGDAPSVPEEAQSAYGAYLGCLMDGPLDPFGETKPLATSAARIALVKGALAACHDQRVTSVAEMEDRFPRTGAWADASKRDARIEEIIGKAEQRITFSVVNAEEFRAITSEMMKCMSAGGGDTCKPVRPLK